MDYKHTDFLVECKDPKLFDETIQQIGAAILFNEGAPDKYIKQDGYYVMRVYGDPGFIKFAIESQGYGKIIKQVS